MKSNLLGWFVGAGAISLLFCGCGNSSSSPESKPPAAATPAASQPATPAPPIPAATVDKQATPTTAESATPAQTPAIAAPVTPVPSAPADVAVQPSQPVDAATAQLTTAAKSQPDPVLSSVGTELADKVNALSQATPSNTALKSQLSTSVQSLVAGKDASALSSFYQTAKSASLTPQQTELAKQVGNAASAYVVQRNFSNLEGSQGDVATLVSSLRKGEVTSALPSLQKIAQNANLTAPQKDLIGSIADKYAPGLSKAAGSLGQGIQSLRNLGK